MARARKSEDASCVNQPPSESVSLSSDSSSTTSSNSQFDDFLEPVPPPTAAQARDPFDGPVVPLLMGALFVAGVAGAVVDGVGMAARTIRRL
jgi:hypothetical protein